MVQEDVPTKECAVSTLPTPSLLRRLSAALSAFTVPDEKNLERAAKGFSKCPVREIDEYFELVAKIGRPLFKWDIIRPAFLWKLQQTMLEMLCVESESITAENNERIAISNDELCQQREFIMQKASEFDGTPFTFQRLCELLITPSRHYKRTDKYLRALEKNINVVTTITENGERVTGVESFPPEQNISPTRYIEQPFFIQVDECDTPLEMKLVAAAAAAAAAGDRPTKENGSSEIAFKEGVPGESAPINLSPSREIKGSPENKKDEDTELSKEAVDNATKDLKVGAELAQSTNPEPMEVESE